MPLFSINNSSLSPISRKKIKLEKDIQVLVEKNLETIFGLTFVAHEFQLNNFRIDTLAYDKESKAFVIIEYKRDQSFSVIDQGYAYLGLMLNNKAEFILEYNEQNKENLVRTSVDWSQSQVIFVASSFTQHQQASINFKDLPIELWEVKQYENDLIDFSQIKPASTSESIQTVTKDASVKKIAKEVKTYTVDGLFKDDWNNSKQLYETLVERVQGLFEPEISAVKHYIKIYNNSDRVFEIVPQKQGLKLSLPMNIKQFKDPEKKLRDVSNMGRWTNGETEYQLNDDSDIDYTLFLIKQVVAKAE
ncbi:hypothetical protein KC614_01885 [candidate division WWE3 bacterium]|uniref:DUF5655 domain-containing protein n=1 Tax=candidate division WWE3 bacterium TaxID=2053526 RepID=A0A955RWK8_UNCKA|nr:hypothetical protein [candidate division WWE3 bacterium]MCA9397959.1 hypothetical protein [candidate division WWE3 bacterium]